MMISEKREKKEKKRRNVRYDQSITTNHGTGTVIALQKVITYSSSPPSKSRYGLVTITLSGCAILCMYLENNKR